MRTLSTLVTIAFAVVAGVHCSASPSPDGGTSTDDPAVTEEPSNATPVSGSRSSTPRDDSSDANQNDPRWAIEAEGLPPMVFTTSVHGDDGALYAAGTFAGSLTVGSDTVQSRGADDVVLVRVDDSGRVAWVKSIGSIRQEKSPKVTFVDGSVRVMAKTEGEVDCGSGKMGRWSSEMFFYCLFKIDGTPLGGGTFPTGAP